MTPNSALEWFPRLDGLPVPESVFVPFEWMELRAILDGRPCDEFERVVQAVVDNRFPLDWPMFIRTDLASAKHNGPAAYRVEDVETLRDALSETVEDNEMKFWLGAESPRALMLREWLDLNASFTAWDGHPVANEWRFFVHENRVTCSHFYWPENAISNPSEDDWRDRLRAIAREYPIGLPGMAVGAAERCADLADYWSVDFAEARDGTWWLIDMATGDRSWHPEDCSMRLQEER